MRTLVIGIPLPNASFDNHSFLSAPSLADYGRVIVEMEAASKAIAEVVAGTGQHKTYTGLPVKNGDSTTEAIGLADVLAMRKREAEWLLDRGGVICCFAHPDVAIKGVRGLRQLRRYSWLPAPPGFNYAHDLFPSFGKPGVRPGAPHAFARYIEAFGQRAGYRLRLNEGAEGFDDYATVFARSEGGAAIGAELSVLNGSIVLLPPLVRLETDRRALAATLLQCLDELTNTLVPSEAS